MQGPQPMFQNSSTTTLPFSLSQLISSRFGPWTIWLNWSGGGVLPILGATLVMNWENELVLKNNRQSSTPAFHKVFMVFLSPDLPVADAQPFVAGQLIQAHRAARADFVGADSCPSSNAPHGQTIEHSGRLVKEPATDFAEMISATVNLGRRGKTFSTGLPC